MTESFGDNMEDVNATTNPNPLADWKNENLICNTCSVLKNVSKFNHISAKG